MRNGRGQLNRGLKKRRATWRLGDAEIVSDELPFGLFMEIEGPEPDIRKVERQLAIKGLRSEHSTYPQLTERYGKSYNGVIEARFPIAKSLENLKGKKKSGPAR